MSCKSVEKTTVNTIQKFRYGPWKAGSDKKVVAEVTIENGEICYVSLPRVYEVPSNPKELKKMTDAVICAMNKVKEYL